MSKEEQKTPTFFDIRPLIFDLPSALVVHSTFGIQRSVCLPWAAKTVIFL
jgi:hypothetical protein